MRQQKLWDIDLAFIQILRRHHIWIARIALFVVFFWFGTLKLLGASPASPLAEALTARTIGMEYFDVSFMILSLIECTIGVLFLFPKAIRIVLPLLFLHMILVCSPLVLVPDLVWSAPFVPTLEGQYIIKNAVIVALAIAIASATKPLKRNS
jgi:uncharacterized membrane protein YkgB